jgi:hypothetical protein
MQVSLYYPRGGGPGSARARADLIIAAFAPGSTHGSARIIRRPEVRERGIEADKWYRTDVDIPYDVYT